MTSDELRAWLATGQYLPNVMRDFHDQKDLFKALHDTVNVEKHSYCGDVSWAKGQCYTVDIFLWWMASHGYTLQKSRHKKKFRNIHQTVEGARAARIDAAKAIFARTGDA